MGHRVLMAKPAHYGIQYVINPWMNLNDQPDPLLSAVQWRQLVKIYENLGVVIEFIPPQPKLPDLVFTANAGLINEGSVVLSSFKYPERQGEEPHFESWFLNEGFQLVRLEPNLTFEGEGDCLKFKDKLLCGFGIRTKLASLINLANLLGKEVVFLELINPYFYHLDTCLLPLEAAEAIVFYPGAFSNQAAKRLLDLKGKFYTLSEAEAADFSANSMVIDNKIIGPISSPALREFLEKLGYEVVYVKTSEFIKSGGSAKCLTLRLN